MSHTAAEEPPAFVIDVDFLFKVPTNLIEGHLPFPKHHTVTHRGVPTTMGVSFLQLSNWSTDFDVTYYVDLHGDAIQMPSDNCICDVIRGNSFKMLEMVTRDPCSLPEHFTVFIAKTSVGALSEQADAQAFWTSDPANRATKIVQLAVQRLPFARIVEKHITANTFAARFIRELSEDGEDGVEVDIRPIDCSSGPHGYSLNPFCNREASS